MSSSSAKASVLSLTPPQLEEIFSPSLIRARARQVFDLTLAGKTSFLYHADKLESTVDYVLKVIEQNYPSLEIPFHSRWGHFRVGGVDRIKKLDQRLSGCEPLERARAKLDLVITSVLLDAGAGNAWTYRDVETGRSFGRSEGLGLASLALFLSKQLGQDSSSPRVDSRGLRSISKWALERHFQVSPTNPLVGVEGRVKLLNNLAAAVADTTRFRNGRPGNILDYLLERHGQKLHATQILRAVLEGFGSIWPGRLSANGINLGDVWHYAKLPQDSAHGQLVPFHKLSQWMTYSLIEPILEAGIEVHGVEELTGLAEYRNGGLMLDADLISLQNPQDGMRAWEPGSELVIEWRALTIHLLDLIGEQVQKRLGKTPQEFPLGKVLEGGTWWAGRFQARAKRTDGSPPLNIVSDGTVF